MKHRNRIDTIKRLVEMPARPTKQFWGLESKCLSELLKQFPRTDFWLKVSFSKKFDSLKMLRTGYYNKELGKKYKRFHYRIPKVEKIRLRKKSGPDYDISTPPQTLRDFLN